MLSENIKTWRKSRGLSQEELAVRLNVVRQTVSKWERSLSVPDSEMLISLADALDTPVATLLGETVEAGEPEGIQAISEKLELVNLQLARMQESRRKLAHRVLIGITALIAFVFAALSAIGGSYLGWDFSNPELAAAGTLLHGFEWLFMRVAPIALIASVAGAVATRRKR